LKYQSCSINHLIARIDIKNNILLLKVKQKFNYQYTEDIPGEIGKEFYRICLDRKIRPGMKIAITAGSRVIDRITKILQSIIKVVKIIKTEPFIVTTMCSHGRATAEGRCKVFGITEETILILYELLKDIHPVLLF
jgi:hypothetical protein